MTDERPVDGRRPGFPFLPILLAGAGSALATLLLARLGLIGTVIGAALTPIIIITVQELGQRPVERVAAVSRVARDGVLEAADTRGRPWRVISRRVRWRRVLAMAAAAFALTVAAFTAVEALLDRPVATDRSDGILGTRSRSAQTPTVTTPTGEEEEAEVPVTGAETDTAPTTTGETGTEPAATATTSTDAETTPPEATNGATTASGPDPTTTEPGASTPPETTPPATVEPTDVSEPATP